ncbi:filamentous haemagglutinin family protein [Achromobacter xylosoxidans]|uniref:filamentous haemagglutinin family protein n=1 Tax=Alcaligenes xylosoxydans xylosoxydans TaxID=85698 RepID=UPI001F148446|nr:filamentous haemagglutinin family protein [Achromobacter xylosoxidans]
MFLLAPTMQALLLALSAGPAWAAGPAFGTGWFAEKRATQAQTAASGRLPGGGLAGIPSTLRDQQRANEQLQRSLANLGRGAAAIAAQQAAQAAARQAAMNQASQVPDGLAEGGLKVDANPLTAGWTNARALSAASQARVNGRTVVTVEQTADKAILNWETFNVGRNTTVSFQQQSTWSVLNRVNDPRAKPSQIQGQIDAPGTVMLVNRNGVVFSGSSQVNVRNLVAAAVGMSDDQFRKGLYSDRTGTGAAERFTPSFGNDLVGLGDAARAGNATGDVRVEAGARIQTAAPGSVTQGGGYVLLLGREAHNAGQISTPGGQTALAAGDSFIIRRGLASDANTLSTTRGNEISARRNAGSQAGLAVNTGLIQSPVGDITLTGHDVRQSGVAVASTSVTARGTIHLLNSATDSTGSILLGQGSTTAILLQDDGTTALDAQRDAAVRPPADALADNYRQAGQAFDHLSALPDRRDQSRIEVTSGGTVQVQDGAMALATGGQVSMSAARRTQLDDGAILDVAGAVGVKVSMESNNLKVNIQGNELRDAPVNREGKTLNNDNIWIDRRTLVQISKGVNGYEKERWYTAGGLLEVGGYLGTSGHGIGEWAAIGGTVTVEGGELVTRKGSLINISGGTLDVASGYINQSWLRGEDGRLYEVSRAPGDLLYKGLYRGFEEAHARWGANATRYFYNSLLAPARRYEDGYTAGRDAGRLVIGTRSAVVEGSIVGEAFQGERQMQARQIVDTGLRQQTGYQQSQLARALAGQLVVGRYVANQLTTNGVTAWGYDLAAAARQIAFTDAEAPLADTLALGDALPAARRDTVWLDATALSDLGLGQITAVASDTVSVRRDLAVATGGAIELYGPHVDIQADLTARGGRLAAGNVLQGVARDTVLAPAANALASVRVASGATLDTRGLWVNLLRDPAAAGVAAYRNGGLIELRGTGVVAVAAGAVLDAGSGATRRIDGKLTGGKGGDITLEMARPDGSTPGPGQSGVILDGEVRSYGVQGGGTLRLSSGLILIDDHADASTPPGGLLLRSDLFASGFSRYDLNGDSGMTVADGTILRVTMPVYRSKSAGPDPAAATLADALERWTPPLFQEDPRTARMSQRLGASLSLSAFARKDVQPEGTLRIGQGAVVEVDPGQTLRLQSRGQMTLQGTLRAPGGQIVVARGADPSADVQAGGLPNSVWLDGQARLDVAGIAVTALDMRGRRYGLQRDGGRIAIDGEFLVIRPGAVLDASGTSMVVDVAQDDGAGTGPRLVGGNGGEISLSAMAGLYLDGLMRAAAGAPGAAGGKLALTLDTPLYGAGTPDSMLRPRELTVAQAGGPSALPEDAAPGNAALTYGYGRIGVDQITAGAFDDVSLFARDLLTFDGDVTLVAGHAISLREGALGNTREGATVRIAAPYVLLDGRSRHAPLVQQPVNATLNDWAPSTQAAAALLRVEADHIDIRNRVNTGMNGTALLNNGGRLAIDRRGYDNVALYSRGDLRFLPAAQAADTRLGGISNASAFLTAGDLSLAAQRIYPATGSVGLAVAGWRGSGVYDNQRVLRVERVNGPLATSAPLSALGSLILNAPTVEQGGVLYAPLGNIRLGLQTDGQNQAVKLLAGSLTSVSAAGLTIPFGGTTDGLSYLYQGVPVEAVGVGGMAFQNLARGMSLAGGAVTVEAGAVIDLSGGGTLAGAAFVSGRGGSTDPLFHPLPRFDGATGRFDLPSLGDRPVYAILPGLPDAYAPVAPRDSAAGYAGSLPRAGETITLGADIPGLPAGTYTLLPAYYALLPGAFRVELGQGALAGNAQSLRGGSWSVSAIRGLSHTGTLDAMPSQALVTPGDVLRRHAQYNEMDYRAFVLADAARRGQPRPMLPADAAALELYYRDPPAAAAGPALRFEGLARFDRGDGGYGGQLVVRSNGGAVEIVNASPTAGFSGISLRDGDLNAIGASRISVGGWTYQPVRGDDLRLATRTLGGSDVYLRSGATLRAPEVMLIAPDARAILIEQGGVINTLGTGSAPYDSRLGYQYSGTGGNNLLVVSNGWLDFPAGSGAASGRIELAACPSGGCSGTAQLYSDGTIAFGANNLVLHDALRYGTRNLVVGATSLNAGSDADLADAAARGVLPGGLRLSQALLRRLLDGDTSVGAPALERVIFSLRDSINFFGSVSLSTLDAATGKSSLAQLVLNTPALYGYGTAADVALLSTDTLVWNGVANGLPGEIADGGAGTGLGTLNLRARRIVLGDANGTPQVPHQVMARQAVGFGNVILDAAERITTGGEGSLEIYRSRGSFVDGKFQYEGGDLLMRTPLLTGAAGSVARLTTGGALRLAGTGAAAADADAPWGATLTLQGDRVDLDSVITLPSGKLTVQSEHALTLGENSRLDLAGRAVALRDQTRYGWGGDVELESRKDNILQAPGAVVDLSARYNQGGRLTAIALDAAAGVIDLRGTFRGQASGEYDAGGTLVPFDAAGVALRAQAIADFTGLNQRLNQGGVTGSRAFQLKRGDLTVGNDIKARHVNITVDNGSLIVNGAIDASGAQVGSIRLAALNDLVINGLLDAHGTLLRVDSRGAIIDSPNRAVVELTSTQGTLRLDAGAAFDLRAGTAVANGIGPGLNDGRARGTLDLNARRINQDDVALDIAGTPAILGAERVYVNAFRRYDDAPLATAPDVTGRTPQVITQDYLDLIDRDSVAYMNASLANAALRARLGGFRLRPGVEIVSATADGDLTVSGDLDLSAYRYGPDADRLDPARRGFGEAGLLLVRAKGDLNIHGSITDGFTPPLGTDDDSRAWRLVGRAGMDNSSGKDLWGQSLILPRAVTLRGGPGGTVFPTTDRESLNFDLPIAANTIKPNVRLPVQVELADTLTLGAGTVLAADVMAADGTRYAKGSVLQQALTLAPGSRLGAGLAVGQAIAVRALTLPKGTPLSIFGAPLALSADLPLAAGAYLPAGTDLQLHDISVDLRDLDANGIQGKIWAVAPMLPAGTSSWSLRLAGGADLDAADTRALRPLSQQGGRGNLTVADLHYMQDLSYGLLGESPIFSVIRTGRGDLDLLAGGSFQQGSYYGIYTAGTPSDSVRDAQGNPVRDALGRDAYNLPRAYDDLVTQIEGYGSVLGSAGAAYEPLVTGDQYAAWYPEGGGNLLMTVQGDMSGAIRGMPARPAEFDPRGAALVPGSYPANWLWRQGGAGLGQQTAWWINFGTYVPSPFFSTFYTGGASVQGFMGIGTLGGGNLSVNVGGDAGVLKPQLMTDSAVYPTGQGLVLAVGSTGRVTPDGRLVSTGGGDLELRVGGALNPLKTNSSDASGDIRGPSTDLNGVVTNLRGALALDARSIGRIDPLYNVADASDVRGLDPLRPTLAAPSGGLALVTGDSAARLDTLGDLVLGGVGDAGRILQTTASPFILNGADQAGGAFSWYTLWTSRTAVDLLSAGGALTPISAPNVDGAAIRDTPQSTTNSYGNVYTYPSRFSAVAATGSIYFHPNAAEAGSEWVFAPGTGGRLEMLAGDGLYGGGYGVNPSGAALTTLATPERPAYIASWNGAQATAGNAISAEGALFAFGRDNAGGRPAAEEAGTIRFYAGGDIVGLRTGAVLAFGSGTEYRAARSVSVQAGRDIVNLRGLFLNQAGNDISQVYAGRDILHANVDVAGPGWLEVSAGRNLAQEDKGRLTSLGMIDGRQTTGKGGAGIVASAGGEGDYAAFARRYLDPANRADPGQPLAGQPGKTVKTYEGELLAWLHTQHGYDGGADQARAYFDALPAAQQRVFLRQVYYAELTAGGREYNDPTGPRAGSYARGRQAIAELYPATGADGKPIHYQGDITLFGGSGIQTLYGGSIHLMAPGGQMVFGVEGVAPPSTAGIITQGAGDIQMYAKGSILLGQSRVMTTFGGNILGWSAEGDINSGRGAKSTVVYTPQRRLYDDVGNVTLSPTVPSTGAGIATLDPIPEVPPGDVDLVAPLGTIDAGEAGIRFSGNVNLAALQVVNAANVVGQGKATGVPALAAVNVAALTSASAAAAGATQGAQENTRQQQAAARRNLPSIISVQILGHGSEPLSGAGSPGATAPAGRNPGPGAAASTQGYDPRSIFQMVGNGELDTAQKARLTEPEQRGLSGG